MAKEKIGVIGGSGLYELEGLGNVRAEKVKTPFGDPSDDYVIGEIAGKEVIFLARHGKGHRIIPSDLNYRANIYGFKSLGVERIISVGAVGSLKEEIKPLDFVVVDQFVERTNQARRHTFFGEGICGHIGFDQPVCSEMAKKIYEAGKETGLTMHPKGTYLNMEGPAFSTLAESNLYRQWGMDIIGMTNMPEAMLAREAEICYSTVALVTDYDCWRHAEEPVTIEMIIGNLVKNIANVKKLLTKVLPVIGGPRDCACASALANAMITDHKCIPKATKKKLDIIIGKYVKE